MNHARGQIAPKDNGPRGRTKNDCANYERKEDRGAAMSWFQTHLDFNINVTTAMIQMMMTNIATVPEEMGFSLTETAASAAIIFALQFLAGAGRSDSMRPIPGAHKLRI
jgi:hypothetical protein